MEIKELGDKPVRDAVGVCRGVHKAETKEFISVGKAAMHGAPVVKHDGKVMRSAGGVEISKEQQILTCEKCPFPQKMHSSNGSRLFNRRRKSP